MSNIGAMVAELIAAGCAPGVAAQVVAQAFVAGVASTSVRGQSADESAERRREKDRIRKQNDRENLRKSADVRGNPQMSEDSSLSKEEKKEESKLEEETKKPSVRGQRLPEGWVPSAVDWTLAVGLIGEPRADSELEKFRDHWKQQPGAKGVKVDWAATWRNWCRRAAEYGGNRNGQSARPLTEFQRRRNETVEILNELDSYVTRSGSGEENSGILSGDPSQRPQGLHSGIGSTVIDLPALGYRTRN